MKCLMILLVFLPAWSFADNLMDNYDSYVKAQSGLFGPDRCRSKPEEVRQHLGPYIGTGAAGHAAQKFKHMDPQKLKKMTPQQRQWYTETIAKLERSQGTANKLGSVDIPKYCECWIGKIKSPEFARRYKANQSGNNHMANYQMIDAGRKQCVESASH